MLAHLRIVPNMQNLGYLDRKGNSCAERATFSLTAQRIERLTGFIEHLTAEKANANTVQRYNKFQLDLDLEKGKRAELSDYKGSGYDRAMWHHQRTWNGMVRQ
jgi:DNA/RNA endonuclease G (NUC1)